MNAHVGPQCGLPWSADKAKSLANPALPQALNFEELLVLGRFRRAIISPDLLLAIPKGLHCSEVQNLF